MASVLCLPLLLLAAKSATETKIESWMIHKLRSCHPLCSSKRHQYHLLNPPQYLRVQHQLRLLRHPQLCFLVSSQAVATESSCTYPATGLAILPPKYCAVVRCPSPCSSLPANEENPCTKSLAPPTMPEPTITPP